MLRPLLGLSVALALNPVTRVAQLLQGLSDKLEKDSKTESKLYEDFVCWCKTIESTKTKSNEVASQRITDLESYIDDISNGRIEFTTEKQDLQKEIAELTLQLEEEKAARDKAHKDFLANEAEMDAAKKALEQAIEVLAGSTENSKEGVLLGVRFALKKAFLNSKNGGEHLEYVENMINKAMQVPENKEWDKMDKDKTTFNKKYKGRSFKIQDMLAEMRKTFSDNLDQARTDEEEAQSNYDKLRAKKEETLGSRKDAAAELNAENSARNKTRAEAEQERDDLVKQRENDTRTLEETAATCQQKKEEYVERKRLRMEEISSIAQAIGVLRSDDARDLFDRSFESQGYFLQLRKEEPRCAAARRSKAKAILQKVNSDRLRALALLTGTKPDTSAFPGNVLEKIDTILADLRKEAEQDEKDKNRCEKLMATKAYEIKELNYAIADNTEEIERNEAIVEKMKGVITLKHEAIAAIEEEVKNAKELRKEQNGEYTTSKADDETAVKLLDKAIAALAKFYTDNNLSNKSFLQKSSKHSRGPGELPAPPPQTWDDANYGGAKGENEGATAIMELIKQDVQKDIRVAEEEETKAQEAHDKFLSESSEQVDDLNAQIDQATVQKTDAEDTIKSETADRTASQEVLAETEALVAAEKPACDFITGNFTTRKDNRAAEVDGLEKAKAVLSGAKFGFLEC